MILIFRLVPEFFALLISVERVSSLVYLPIPPFKVHVSDFVAASLRSTLICVDSTGSKFARRIFDGVTPEDENANKNCCC
jgi:hypothetical protein